LQLDVRAAQSRSRQRRGRGTVLVRAHGRRRRRLAVRRAPRRAHGGGGHRARRSARLVDRTGCERRVRLPGLAGGRSRDRRGHRLSRHGAEIEPRIHRVGRGATSGARSPGGARAPAHSECTDAPHERDRLRRRLSLRSRGGRPRGRPAVPAGRVARRAVVRAERLGLRKNTGRAHRLVAQAPLHTSGRAAMIDHNAERLFFLALVCAITIAFFWLIHDFLQPIFWAIALGIVVYPLHTWIARRLAPRASLAAALSVTVVVLVVVLPLMFVVAAVTTEAAPLVARLNAGELGLQQIYEQVVARVPQFGDLLARFGIDAGKLEAQVSSAAVDAGKFLAASAVAIGQNTVRVLVFFFLMLYLLFFFLRDGETLLEGLVRALPLGDARERLLLDRFATVSRATIKGTLVVGAVQGAIGGIAFAILGVGAPVLWGTVMALLSIVPAVGTALVWLPASILLLANGQIVAGIVLILIGVFGIGMVDNLLRPILVGRDTRMPDYLILLATLGGLAGFGLAGIVIGPIIAAFFVT